MKKRSFRIANNILFVLSLLLVLFSYFLGKKTVNRIAEKQLETVVKNVTFQNKQFFDRIEDNLRIAAGWYQSGILDDNDINGLRAKFRVLLENNKSIGTYCLVKPGDNEYGLARFSAGYRFYVLPASQSESQITILDSAGRELSVIRQGLSNCFSGKRSYLNLINYEDNSINWNQAEIIPGPDSLIGQPITIKVNDLHSGRRLYLAAYIPLNTLLHFIHNNKISSESTVILFTPDGHFFDVDSLMNNSRQLGKMNEHMTAVNADPESIFAGVFRVWKENQKGDSAQYHKFKWNRKTYWAAFRPDKREISDQLWIALVTPAGDKKVFLTGSAGTVSRISLILIGLSSIAFFILIRHSKSGSPQRDPLTSDDILALIRNGETNFVEFKSTVRMNLHSGKPGKEIELAWLKSVVAFLNTDGGTIFIGVNDNQEIQGLGDDRFENDDKCLLHIQNLVRQHIGLEFIPYIRIRLQEFLTVKIVVIETERCMKPAFLISGEKEQFFIRSGPSSVELPASKIISYLKEHKKDSD